MTYTVIQYSYFGLMAVVLIWGASLAWRWRKLPEFAGQVYDSNVAQEAIDGRIDRDAYIASYVKAEGPRLGTYRCLLAFGFLLSLPILIPFFSWILNTLWFRAGLSMGPADLAQIALDFFVIMIVMAIFVGITYLVTAYYYRTRPPSLKSEIRRLEELSK
ncbi:MAG: hypothetical protein AAGB16_02855 [Pseudomonadota bacterium]